MAATTSFKLDEEVIAPPTVYISENVNGDLVYTVTYQQAMTHAQLFIRKNNDGFYILASGMGPANNNGDGTFTYTFTHSASHYNDGDDVYVRFYSHNPQLGKVFSPGPEDNFWSDAYRVGSISEPTPITPPTNVSNLTVTNITYNSYQLTWDAAMDESGIAHYKVMVDGQLHIVDGLSYIGSGSPLAVHSVAVFAVDNTGVESSVASTTSFQLLDEPALPTSQHISKAVNGDVIYTITYPQAMSQAQLFVKKNSDSFNILATGMGSSVTNNDGTVTYTFTHPARNYSADDDIYVRFYSNNTQVGPVFSPGPGETVWSDAFSY